MPVRIREGNVQWPSAGHAPHDLQLVTTEKDFVRMRGDPALVGLAAAAKTLPVTLEFMDPAAIGKRLADALAKVR